MDKKSSIRFPVSSSDNRKPVPSINSVQALSFAEGSKTCAEPRRRIQNRKRLALSVIVFVLVVAGAVAEAQQPTKIPRIGVLGATPLSANLARIKALREGLGELGYVEGKNIAIEWRFLEGKVDRLPALAAELTHLKVDVLVAFGPTSTHAAKEATNTIPIVMAQVNDPIAAGFVASLARPGGNITGLSIMAPELSGKQLELLKEIVPKLSRVAIFGTSTQPGNAQSVKEAELAAKTLGLELQYLDVVDPEDVDAAFRNAVSKRAHAIIFLQSPVFSSRRKALAELAVKNRLPAMYPQTDYMDAGGLMFYGPSTSDLFHRAATYVDKILKGRTPADLPVEQPTKFEFIINLKAAKQIGLTIPPNVLARADRVLK
jgi:putative tryptophan/tyrosine transport system substrate-binding protein